MLRLRFVPSPCVDTRLRAALSQPRGAANRGGAEELVSTLRFEMDGVDLARGRAEGAVLTLIGRLWELVDAIRFGRAWSGSMGESSVAAVPVDARVTLSWMAEGQPRAATATVGRRELSRAVEALTGEFLAAVEHAVPGAATARRFREMKMRLARPAASRSTMLPRRALHSAPIGDHRLSLFEQPPRLVLEGPSQRRLFELAGPHDKVLAELSKMLSADTGTRARLDRRRREVRLGRSPSLPWDDVASALRQLRRTIGDTGTSPLFPALEAGPEQSAEERHRGRGAAVPAAGLPSRGLRRVVFQRVWRDGGVGRLERVSLLRAGLLVVGARGGMLLSPTGQRLWSTEAAVLPLDMSAGQQLLLCSSDGTLVRLRPSSRPRHGEAIDAGLDHPLGAASLGGESWTVWDRRRLRLIRNDGIIRTLPLPDGAAVIVSGAQLWLVSEGEAELIDSGGRRLARHRVSGQPLRAFALPSGGCAVATDDDALIGITAGGTTWRLPLEGRLQQLAVHRRMLVVTLADEGQGGVFDTETGTRHWCSTALSGGAVVTVTRAGLLAAGRGGAWTRMDWRGAVRLSRPACDDDDTLSPHAMTAPAVGREVVLTAGSHLHLFAADSGRRLASMEPEELGPRALMLMGDGRVAGISPSGIVECFSARGHLRTV